MKQIAIFLIFFSMLCSSAIACKFKKKTNSNAIPNWVVIKIRELEKEKPHQLKSFIAEYQYKGKRVFYIPADCCDQLNPLYDEAGNILCYPSGGFTGNGNGKCTDFNFDPKSKKIIWEDIRQKKETHD
jgi:hypothetical protein